MRAAQENTEGPGGDPRRLRASWGRPSGGLTGNPALKSSEFWYELPEESIAQSVTEPRHDSRLLDTRDLSDHRFLELSTLLDPGDLLVVNETRVRAARLLGRRRQTGGRIEILLLEQLEDGSWEALARPARRLKPGVEIDFDGVVGVVRSSPDEGKVTILFDIVDFEDELGRIGELPLPPYFTGELGDPARYQTMFAATPGSAAAPTAGLHFTPQVVDALQAREIRITTVDLHVSIDTFRPITSEEVEDHRMHSEWCMVPEAAARAIDEARHRAGRVVAVGTTVVRTLETMADDDGGVRPGSTRTDLFITPGYRFRAVDALVTNFHLPGSTLLVLLSAFMGEGWRHAYETAIERGYRFLSFGDAMFATRHS